MSKRSNKRRLQKKQKHAAKRKQKRRLLARKTQMSSPPSLGVAAVWPLHEVLISESWRDTHQLTQILVVRRGPYGYYAVGAAIVDLACLGVKSAFGRVTDEAEYRKLRADMREKQNLIEADTNLVAKLIREAIAYARDLGFKPDSDVRQLLQLLKGADPDACTEKIPLGGPEGKPLFIAGPYDNIPRIMTRLEKKLGPEGFHAVVPLFVEDDMEAEDE